MTSLAPNPNPHLSPFLPTPDLLGQPPPGLTAEERAEWHVHDLQHARMLWILTHTTDPDMPIDLVGQRARSATRAFLTAGDVRHTREEQCGVLPGLRMLMRRLLARWDEDGGRAHPFPSLRSQMVVLRACMWDPWEAFTRLASGATHEAPSAPSSPRGED